MAFGSVGLKTHIWNNHLASAFLLICYPLLVLLLTYGVCVLLAFSSDGTAQQPYAPNINPWLQGLMFAQSAAPFVIGAVALWYVIATLLHRHIINSVTHANGVSRTQEPKLYSLLENLCISRGLPMPHLAIIETPQLNAFASGLRPANAQVTVTRGLLDTLNDDELEAVLAHELSHIINRDIQLLIISAVFVGLLAFLCEASWRMLRYGSSDSKKGAQLIFAIAVVSSVGYLLSILLRFALSRKREYMADAGAVELTKNPDAMVRALDKISGKSEMPDVPADFKEMMIDYPRTGLFGLFSTHPPIEDRISVLRAYGGATTDIAPRIRPKRSPWEKRRDIWK